jgi:hypothetical protein
LKAEKKDEAIGCDSDCGPHFGDIGISENCNANARNLTRSFGTSYTNGTGLGGETFFTGSICFKVKESEVFEITGSTTPTKSCSPALPEFRVSQNRKKL